MDIVISPLPESFLESMDTVISSLLGILGVLLGILVAEYFKRKDRESLYSEEIFKRRLSIYEQLFFKLNKSTEIAEYILNEKSLSKEKRKELWSSAVLDLTMFTDKNKLYLSEEIIAHSIGVLIGLEDAYYLSTDKKKEATSKYYKGLNDANNLIKEIVGINRIDRFFYKVNKPELKSNLIDYFNQLKKEYENKK